MSKNNEQIDKTDYYRLPCGKYLEDFIDECGFSFAFGSAIKYLWRAGKKNGESKEKDMQKCEHFLKFVARREGKSIESAIQYLDHVSDLAHYWDGKPVDENMVFNQLAWNY